MSYAASGGDPTLIGFAFFTTDVTPRLYAYKGRITMLVGMDTAGSLIDVQVVYHYEPFGYFSIDPPGFAKQFRNKSILDPLEVGEDIDAVSRATITVTAATRVARPASGVCEICRARRCRPVFPRHRRAKDSRQRVRPL